MACVWLAPPMEAPRGVAPAWLLAKPALGAAWPTPRPPPPPPTPPRAKASIVTETHPSAMTESRSIVLRNLSFRMEIYL